MGFRCDFCSSKHGRLRMYVKGVMYQTCPSCHAEYYHFADIRKMSLESKRKTVAQLESQTQELVQ